MNDCTLPCSPNWYLSSVSSGSESGLYAFGAKNHVYVYDLSNISERRQNPQLLVDDKDNLTGLSHKIPKFISCYTEHELRVTSVCLSPDPEQLICCSADETLVKLWDISSLTTIQAHNIHKERITCMAWCPCDVDLVLTASEKGTVVMWKLKSNTVTSFQPQRNCISCIKASPHSAALVALGYHLGSVLIVNIDCDQPQVVQKLRGLEGDVTSVCWCPVEGYNFLDIDAADDSGILVAAGGGRLIKMWNSSTGKEVVYKKLPSGPVQRFSSQDPMGKKLWLDLVWPKSSPDYIISNSLGPQGDLFLWSLHSRVQEPQLFDSTSINKHARVIFNIRCVGDKLCTFSLDRTIAVWDLKSCKAVTSWCSFGGFLYCIRASPVDPGMVAVGVGDNIIRVWNQNNKSRPFDVSSISCGLRTLITSVAWHPEKEGLLAYGTEDGRVGVVNALTVKPPMMSSTFHKRTVYIVCWGPPVHADTGSHLYHVYSVGDGTVLQHFIGEHGGKKDAVNLKDAICAVNGPENQNMSLSEMVWRKNYTAFAVGCDNGSVHMYNFPGLRHIFTINVQHKIINCMRWHPEVTAESLHCSPCRNWVALAGNDRYISVIDLPTVFVGEDATSFTPVTITQALCQLKGHVPRTTDICWSPHHDGRLVSVGYDGTAIVWNVKNGEGLVSYSEHSGRILTVLWSYLDPDLIMTGGFDFTLRVWRVSAQSNKAIDAKERKKKKRKAFNNASCAPLAEAIPTQDEITASQQEIKELQDLLMAKQQELLSQLESTTTERSALQTPVTNGNLNDPEGKLLSHESSKDAHFRSQQESSIITLDASSSTSLLSSRVVTASGGTATRLPSTLIGLGTSQSSLFPSNKDHESSLSSDKYRKSVAVEHEDESSDDDDESDAVVSQNRVPSFRRLVSPVRPLFPKSGFAHTSSKPGHASLATTSADSCDKSKTRKPKAKSLFPVSSSANNRGKSAVHEDIVDLGRIITGSSQDSAELLNNKPHLGLFTDRLGTHQCLLQESAHHLSHDNMEYHLQLELWRGNVAGAIQIARQRNELSDWIVSMAPLASHDLWELVSEEYAEQLEEDGQYHKAATYLLAAHKIHQAIDMFRRHKLYREAVSLARLRLSSVDPLLDDLYTEWGQSLLKDGLYEQAAKCYLAVRHIEEAGKALTRRHDQSSLKTACHVTLLANEKQQGMVYAYRLLSQYLMAGEWQEAYKFLSEHDSLKILLPVLYTHELLVQHLTVLCPSLSLIQKQLTPEMFSQWDSKEVTKGNNELPEFLLDKSETDPVVPWEPFLIGKHTFPHHVLRVWHQHLDAAMLTQNLEVLHAAISKLVPQRQKMVDLPSLLVLVSVDITLCVLALLTSETSSAISHLLQALSSLHQANHVSLQQALCRLMLTQGPKYLLKLQQEFNASRVLITLESHGDMDKAGGERHNSIKKFLTDIKDDSAISMSSVRCRELDCLRAYYYLAVLDFLRENFPCVQTENDSHDGMPNGKLTTIIQNNADANGNQNCAHGGDELKLEDIRGLLQTNSRLSSSELNKVVAKGDSQRGVGDENMADLDQNGKLSYSISSASSLSEMGNGCPVSDQSMMGNGDASEALIGSYRKDCDRRLDSTDISVVTEDSYKKPLVLSQKLVDSSSSSASQLFVPKPSDVSSESSSVDPPVPSSTSLLNMSPLKKAANGTCSPVAKAAMSPSHRSPSSPLKNAADSSGISPGEDNKLNKITSEMTESSSPTKQTEVCGHLNYTNLLRLSKGILWDIQAKREALTETLGYVHQAISQHLLFNRSVSNNPCDPAVGDIDPSVTNNRSSNFQHAVNSDLEEDGGCLRTRQLPPSSDLNLDICRGRTDKCESSQAESSLQHARSLPVVLEKEASHRSPLRSLSENYSTRKSSLSASSKLEQSEVAQVEQDLLGLVKSEPLAFQKSRKVLWMDGQETCGDEDPAKSTFQISKLAPDGNPIPVEWDELPVDIKYSMPYITLPLLKQEQENISQELKKVPDVSQIPFPTTTDSVKKLLQASLRSLHLSRSDKSAYIKQLNDWAAVFAVTTHQQKEMEALFAAVVLE